MKILTPIVMSSFLILGLAALDHVMAAQDSYHFSQNCKLDFAPDQDNTAADLHKDKSQIMESHEVAVGGSPFDPRGRQH